MVLLIKDALGTDYLGSGEGRGFDISVTPRP